MRINGITFRPLTGDEPPKPMARRGAREGERIRVVQDFLCQHDVAVSLSLALLCAAAFC